ncbi:MAG TPA: 2Fe-2S iron-sulfur cluster-binding protein [Labilithrix sp.]|nr:2Fe-2S iron-sulfur cluster-binding protein [Labilithrix sp.]
MTITLDGEPIRAERGEPVAAALLAAGKLMIARSPKFHRPRGPACMRAACDGCLARVDETPNVMTCMVAAEEGTAVVSQNRLGPREVDLLRMTDWFFPDGMNHHELFAGVPGVQSVMQAFARRVAGLGRMPVDVESPHAAARRTADVVVVGGGPSGMAVAAELARAGRSVEVLDDQLAPGGGVLALGPAEAAAFDEIRASFMDHVAAGRVRLRSRTVAGGMYGTDLLVVGPDGAEVLEARSLVFASGAHDGALAFEGNDVPGVMSARAAGMLLGRGVLPGKRIVVVVAEGGGPFGAAFARAAPGALASVSVVHGEPVAVRGASRPKAVTVRDSAGREKEYPADLVLVDAPRSPAYELAEQAGATLAHEPRGFVVRTEGGRIGAGRYAVGELTGTPFEAGAIAGDAARVAATIAAGR